MYVEKCRRGAVSIVFPVLIPNVSTPFGIVFAGLLTTVSSLNIVFRVRVDVTRVGKFVGDSVLLFVLFLVLLLALRDLEFALGEVFADSSSPLDKDGESVGAEGSATGEGEFDASTNTFSSPKNEEFVVFKSIRLIIFWGLRYKEQFLAFLPYICFL